MQTGSGSQPERGCSVQVFPPSRVRATARPVPRLSRIESISTPGSISATCDSVVLLRAGVPISQVSPPSRLSMMVEDGIFSVLMNCIGNTSVPSAITMPRPGPWKVKYHSGCLICAVRFRGADQLRPSSSETVIMSWAVSPGSMPCPTEVQARWPGMPWVHVPRTYMRPVLGSASTDGSPTPFSAWGLPPHSPMSSTSRIGSQVRPPSVERLMPTSMSAWRS